MTGYVADLSWKSGVLAIEKLDRLRSTMVVNVLRDMIKIINADLYLIPDEPDPNTLNTF